MYRYLWDGDVILHEWDYAEGDRPNTIVAIAGEIKLDRSESATTSVVSSRHTMIMVISSGKQTMTSMVTSATFTAAGSSFLSAS